MAGYIRGIKVSCDSINSCHETNDDLICDVIESNLRTLCADCNLGKGAD